MTPSPIRKHAVRRPRWASEDLPAVFHGSATKAALHRTVHGAKKSAEQLAFECRISPSYLYRACLEGDSGCRFPLDLAVPLMRATGDYRLLDVLAGECDRVVVSHRRVARLKRADAGAINEVARNFNDAMGRALAYLAAPDRAHLAELVEALRRHCAEVVALTRAIESAEQGDLL